jgi:tetratricopeptide (TPR) repeat protein
MYEESSFDFRDLIEHGERIAFLAGAGISMNPPSNLPSARQMMDAVVRFGAAEDTVDRILSIKELRYEMLVEVFRDLIDRNLHLIDFFAECKEPNAIHEFLASMIRKGHYVLTTNFDYLIEHALAIHEKRVKIIITEADFISSGDPIKNSREGSWCLYKIHGSIKNIITGEDTRASLITTIDSLGRKKEGTIFAVETFKRPFFDAIAAAGTLVVMGYSGGDDFDIVPTLNGMKGLNRIVWLSHAVTPGRKPEIRILKKTIEDGKLGAVEGKEDEILSKIGKDTGAEIIKIKAPTLDLIKAVTSNPRSNDQTQSTPLDPLTWIRRNFDEPSMLAKYNFSSMVFQRYGLFKDALHEMERVLEVAREARDPEAEGLALGQIGNLHRDMGNLDRAITYIEQASDLHVKHSNHQYLTGDWTNLGVIYSQKGDYHKAEDYLKRALDILLDVGKTNEAMAVMANLGSVYKKLGRFEEAITMFEKVSQHRAAIGDVQTMIMDYGNLGGLYHEIGNTWKSTEYIEKAYEIARKIGDIQSMGNAANNLAAAYVDLKDLERAEHFFKEALDIAKKTGDVDATASNLNNLGMLTKMQGRYTEAIDYFRKALQIDETTGNLEGMAIDEANIGYSYLAQADEAQANPHFKRATDIYQSLDNAAAISKIRNTIEAVKKAMRKKGELEADSGIGSISASQAPEDIVEKIGELYDDFEEDANAETAMSLGKYLASCPITVEEKRDWFKKIYEIPMFEEDVESIIGLWANAVQMEDESLSIPDRISRARSLLNNHALKPEHINEWVRVVYLTRNAAPKDLLNFLAMNFRNYRGLSEDLKTWLERY